MATSSNDSERPSPEQRIAEMVASGSVSPVQAEGLLRALPTPPSRPKRMLLLDPHEWLTPTRSALCFAGVWLSHVLLTRAALSFDGAFDAHRGSSAMPLPMALLQVTAVMVITTLLFWLAARLLGSKARAIDVAGVVALMRVPLSLMAAATLLLGQVTQHSPMWRLLLVGLLALGMLSWTLVLLFRGMRWASGLSGKRLWALYLGTMVVAEALLLLLTRTLLV